jgi:hypothetical protein
MRLTIFLSAILVVSFSVLDCSSASNATQQPKPFPLGDYQYTGYASNGDKIVEGQLSITSIESDRLKGEWQLNQVGDAVNIGPQVGTGNLAGSISKGEIYINLNPNMADNNVRLRGKVEGNRFRGTWSFDGEGGALNKGTFKASKK